MVDSAFCKSLFPFPQRIGSADKNSSDSSLSAGMIYDANVAEKSIA
jgi:hypothetical protein|tara:strand:- start:210 stop:347 length:138 start_codon:yes stop_codon:yes gene_type:complete